ncbi:hypothetical protein SKAU_G00202280 [Synaphobranchus kaupii]|uniref:Uncharacterized protein n=1 Tax=Synaphobranchus kaupii TaxID=118154 RepID=A0A9Q1FFR7_SYNKA|nr:hypothetical protein SKAU_G00202280 [Synaphobranchus kaupii]
MKPHGICEAGLRVPNVTSPVPLAVFEASSLSVPVPPRLRFSGGSDPETGRRRLSQREGFRWPVTAENEEGAGIAKSLWYGDASGKRTAGTRRRLGGGTDPRSDPEGEDEPNSGVRAEPARFTSISSYQGCLTVQKHSWGASLAVAPGGRAGARRPAPSAASTPNPPSLPGVSRA